MSHLPNPTPPTAFAGPPEALHTIRRWLSIAACGPQIGLPTPNFLITGPAGSGKSFAFQIAAAERGVPVVELDPLDYLPALGGAMPRRLDDAISEFCMQIGNRVGQGWLGIILMRGIDRLARAGEVGQLLQANLASLMRRSHCRVHLAGRMLELNPSNQITFAFTSSLPDFKVAGQLGFATGGHPTPEVTDAAPDPNSLHSYGFSSILLDELKIRLHLPALDRAALGTVLAGAGITRRALGFCEECLGIRLVLTPCAHSAIVEHAHALGRNAHSLEAAVFAVIDHVCTARERDWPGRPVVITADAATVNGGPPSRIEPWPRNPSAQNNRKPEIRATRTLPTVLTRPARSHASSSEIRLARADDLTRWIA